MLRNFFDFEITIVIIVTPYFISSNNDFRITWRAICPNCSSRGRHRGLAVYIPKMIEKMSRPIRVLHFAPEPVITKKICIIPTATSSKLILRSF